MTTDIAATLCWALRSSNNNLLAIKSIFSSNFFWSAWFFIISKIELITSVFTERVSYSCIAVLSYKKPTHCFIYIENSSGNSLFDILFSSRSIILIDCIKISIICTSIYCHSTLKGKILLFYDKNALNTKNHSETWSTFCLITLYYSKSFCVSTLQDNAKGTRFRVPKIGGNMKYPIFSQYYNTIFRCAL